MNQSNRIYLFDTTLRDGAQTQGVDFSAEDKRAIAEALDRLGIDYIDKRNSYLQAVTRADIARVAKRLLDAKSLSFSVVGQPAGLPSTAVKIPGIE